jgi:hypothetical protein
MMGGVLQVGLINLSSPHACSAWARLTKRTVFSAPKYCDSTENKGAYINVGPDLKLQYHKFDAVPHPDIKPMVCEEIIPKAKAATDNTFPPQAYAQNSLMSMM